MKIELKLLAAKPETPDGFPLVVELSHQGKRKQKTVCFCHKAHFSESAKMITEKHPDYDILAPRLMDIKMKARKIILGGASDVAVAFDALLKTDTSGITMAEFGAAWAAEQNALIAMYEKKGDTKNRNKVAGNLRSVENALKQFCEALPNVSVAALDYEAVMRFRKQQQLAGNSTNTIHLYLRTVRALYNKALRQHRFVDNKPFEGAFAGLKIKSFMNKKKYLDKQAVAVLEGMELSGHKAITRDLFLLQFYFGGADLTDIYHLKKFQVRKGRVRFERNKVSTGNVIDLKVHPKAMAIINKYPSADEWLFPWRKDVKGYAGFRRKVQKLLIELQDAQNAKAKAEKNDALKIEVLPDGGKLGIKVARHTFANIAKRLMVDPDIIRELMGHERDEVDNFYKDKFSQAVRDEALFTIIG